MSMRGLELGACATVVGVALVHLIVTGYQYSLQFEAGGKWDGYAPGLRPGWLLGRRVDLSDAQWREFRAAVPPLAAVLGLFAALSHALRRLVTPGHSPRALAIYYVAFAAVFLSYLHGVCAAFVFALVAANYAVAQATAGRRYGAVAIWAFNVGALLAARIWEGFPFASLLGPHWAWLDSHRGAVRWHICLNITTLRMLSYSLDLHWARCAAAKVQQAEQLAKRAAAAPASARERQRTPLPGGADYGLLPCLAHALYPPLYLAGPVITFQDFAWQLRQRSGGGGGGGGAAATPPADGQRPAAAPLAKSNRSSNSRPETPNSTQVDPAPAPAAAALGNCSATSGRAVLVYAARLVLVLTCLELVTHCLYFNSIAVHRLGAKYRQYGLRYDAPEVGLTAWWVLAFMWLKFTTIWRLFRLAALAEGVDPPENMARCFANNYEVAGFWRGWHASYNRWLVRYMYVPLGGTARRALTIWPIFLFVALWHDLEWRLLSWAWLICLAFLPEMAAQRAAGHPRFDPVRRGAAFRAACAAAAALNIGGLMAANMVGFVVGPAGMAELFRQLAAAPHYVAAALGCFFCAAQLMFALREREAAAVAAKAQD